MKLTNNGDCQLVIALDVATKVSGIAIYYQQVLIATWSVILNPELKFGANKLVADLQIINQLFNDKLIAVLNYLKQHQCLFNQIGIIIEQSLHDHHGVNQKIQFYSGLYLALIDQVLKIIVDQPYQMEIKMLPPNEWMLRVFNQQLDRQSGKQFSKQKGWQLIHDQQPYLQQLFRLEQPLYYQVASFDDNQADAINIGFNYQILRDVSTIKADLAKRQLEQKQLKRAIKSLEKKLLKYQAINWQALSPKEQQTYLEYQNQIEQKQQDLKEFNQERLIDKTIKIEQPVVNFDWKEKLILKAKSFGFDLKWENVEQTKIEQVLLKTFYRKYYCNRDYLIENNQVKIINQQMSAKKITGSRFHISYDVGRFHTLFSVWCKYWNLDLPVFNQKYVQAGDEIEDKLVAWLQNNLWYLNHFENDPVVKLVAIKAKDCQYDYFPNQQIFGGIPDAIATLASGKQIILEFKSANRKYYSKWLNEGVPIAYIEQAMLYAYLNQSFAFVIINHWLEDDDYEKIANLEIDPANLFSAWFDLDQQQIKTLMFQVQEQYQKYYQLPISPIISKLTIDQTLLKYLMIDSETHYIDYLWNNFIDYLNEQKHPFDEKHLINLIVEALH